FPDKLDYALHTLSPTQRIAFESWAPKHEREDAKADAAVLSEVFGTSLTPQEPSAELKARVMAQVAHTEQIQPVNELGTDD
ncbi:anti-sigma factor, partial [Staphylococcus capitis]